LIGGAYDDRLISYYHSPGPIANPYFLEGYIAFNAVPLKPTIVSQLFGFGLLGLLAWRRKRQAAAAL
jgi:hypothetical protein